MTVNSLWFADYNGTYNLEVPRFFTSNELRIIKDIEDNYSTFRRETARLWEADTEDSHALYGNYDAYDDKQFPPRSWKKIVIKAWGLQNIRLEREFPSIFQFVKNHPEICSCHIAKTSPNSYIKPHSGETNAIIRIHLGLKIPDQAKGMCSIRVMDKVMNWENGRAFGFIDALRHEVWNQTSEDRYIMIVDVIRPEFRRKTNYIFTRIIATQLMFATLNPHISTTILARIPSGFIVFISLVLFLPVLLLTRLSSHIRLVKL
jgi:ornithine lipid ester-linked acyl 2-hydroxylase